MGLFSIFKSKQRREQERETAIRNVLSLHKRQINQLRKHERDYMEKAVRAKNAQDTVNFKRLCNMVAQTIMHRRALDSQLLYFETILQTRDRARLFGEFGKGMKAMAKSVGEVFKEMNDGEMVRDIDNILQQSLSMEDMMNSVLDRVSEASDAMTEDARTQGIVNTDIEMLVSNMATTPSAETGSAIDSQLKAIEDELAKQEGQATH